MKTALLLIAHGSPRVEANADVLAVGEMVQQRKTFDYVAVAYLDCNPPTIGEAFVELVEQGADRITAVPYFLHEGRHTALDVPEELHEVARSHPHVELLLGDFIGVSQNVTEVLAQRAAEIKTIRKSN